MSNVWNIFQEKLENNQTLTKKASTFLGCPVKDINISDIFYQIQKFLRASWASIITTNGINFLMTGPLMTDFLLTSSAILSKKNATRDTWHVTHDMWHMLGGWKISQNLSSLALTVWEVCCFEYISTNQDLPLLIMKVFVEQPPATPGQLNMLVPDIYLSQLVVILFFR